MCLRQSGGTLLLDGRELAGDIFQHLLDLEASGLLFPADPDEPESGEDRHAADRRKRCCDRQTDLED